MKPLSLALRVLADLVLLAALAGMGWWLGTTFAGRVGYPFDLEWMEGGMLLHAFRVRDGLPIYVAPSPEFIPYIYPPGYAWVVGMLGRFVELGYPLARTVSLVSTGLAALVLAWAVRQEGHRWTLGLGAAALFLSCYEEVGAFFDLVRTDGQQLFLMALALVVLRLVVDELGVARGWGLCALAFLAVTLLSPTFVLKLALTAYADNATSVAAGTAAVLGWMALRAAGAARLVSVS